MQSMISKIQFGSYNHLPNYNQIWIDGTDLSYYALNFAHHGFIEWTATQATPKRLESPVAWWTWPRHRFQYGQKPPGPGWNHRFVTFRGSWVNDLQAMGILSVDPLTGFRFIGESDRFAAIFDELFEALDRKETLSAWARLLDLLAIIKAEPIRLSPHQLTSSKRVTNLIKKINANPFQAWTEQMASDFCHVSPSHLRRLFACETGTSLKQFLIATKMRIASQELRQTDTPLKAMAERFCGGDEAYFSRLFRQHYDHPPGEYRRRNCLIPAGTSKAD